jgi:hypothetical protein
MVEEAGLFSHRFSAQNLRKLSKKRVTPSPLFSPEFKKMVEEAGYSLKHIFSVDKTSPPYNIPSLKFWPSVNTIYHMKSIKTVVN